jgi:gliding motility-associated lipoprotein GldD
MGFFLSSKTLFQFFIIGLLALFASCGNDGYVPKPHGYLRIDLPGKTYHSFDSTFPYRFDYPTYSKIGFDQYTSQEPYWMNIDFRGFNAKIYLSYKDIRKAALAKLIEDSRTMVYKHAPKAIGIRESIIDHSDRRIFGMAYSIEGKEAASPFQFYVTDSTRNFLRGALYFNVVPNNDSLQPVIDFVISDIDHLIATLNWKN